MNISTQEKNEYYEWFINYLHEINCNLDEEVISNLIDLAINQTFNGNSYDEDNDIDIYVNLKLKADTMKRIQVRNENSQFNGLNPEEFLFNK